MNTRRDILILIPALNEAERIVPVIRGIREQAPRADILVIDDGSSDDTSKIVTDEGAIVVKHPFNLGVGAALQTGYKYAVTNGYQFVIQLDGDGQHDPIYLPTVFSTLEDKHADVVIGSRFLAQDEKSMSVPRRVGGKIFSFLLSVLIQETITDPTSGFRGMRRSVLEFCISDQYGFDYPDADFLLTLHRSGFKIIEIPMKISRRNSGQSQHRGLKPVYYVLKMFLSIFIILLRKKTKIG